MRIGSKRNSSKRVLVTGVSTYWGGLLAEALEGYKSIEAIIGVDSKDPIRELARTEFVKVSNQHSLLRRIVEAAEIDTVIDSRIVSDSLMKSPRAAHENNVIGTMNILAACSTPSPVRKLVFKSSAHFYGCEQGDPAFFTEEMKRQGRPKTAIESDTVEAETAVREFALKNPHINVSIIRFTNVLGPQVKNSHMRLFSLPVIPCIFGFDPRYQFIHEDDVVEVLKHMVLNELPGIYNAGADGVLALSEIASLLDKQLLPVLPPKGTFSALAPLRRLGIGIPLEMIHQLRFGRAVDNRRLKATGFRFRYTTRETVEALSEQLRLEPVMRGVQEPYRYEREVEEFLKWSPSVRKNRETTKGQQPLIGR